MTNKWFIFTKTNQAMINNHKKRHRFQKYKYCYKQKQSLFEHIWENEKDDKNLKNRYNLVSTISTDKR